MFCALEESLRYGTFFICAEDTSQADMFTCQFGAAREPELSRKA